MNPTSHWLALVGGLSLSACQSAGPSPSAGRLNVAAVPLSLGEIGGASYSLTVTNGNTPPNNLVWAREGLSSARYGDGRGAISYVGPCDASQNPHTVALVLEGLRDADGEALDPTTFENPAPAEDPVTLTVDCVPNGDARVEFNLTIMRDAEQGFFDVAVNFEDIFCSAKVDCASALLHDGDKRGPTAILAFACTAGSSAEGAQETWLHMSDVAIECDGQPTLYFDPTSAPGQHGPLGTLPTLFETAIYRGREDLPGLDKCYWNAAFGVRPGAAPNCRLRAQATASHASLGPTGLTPSGSVYPYVDFEVTLTDLEGNLICDNQGLDDPLSGVSTHYTSPAGAAFAHEWACDPNAQPVDRKLACDGAFAGGQVAAALPSPEGVSVTIGGIRSPTYTLPAGAFLAGQASCCVNPCCDSGGP